MSKPKTRHTFRRQSRTSNSVKLAFLLPALLVFTSVMILPVVVNAVYALTDWTGYGSDFKWIGLDNFIRLADDVDVLRALVNTIVFTMVNAPLQIAIGLALALILKRPGRLIAALRTVIVLPIAISGVVLGFLGSIIFDTRGGLLATAGSVPGLEPLAQNWLGDSELAMASVITMNLWQWSGFTMLIFLAGLATIPSELYEAATLDGAGHWGQFRHVTWPLLAPAATINIVLTIIGGLKVFDIIYVLTGGGPGNATESVVMRVNSQGAFGEFSYSSAISLALTLVVFTISVALLAALRRREVAL